MEGGTSVGGKRKAQGDLKRSELSTAKAQAWEADVGAPEQLFLTLSHSDYDLLTLQFYFIHHIHDPQLPSFQHTHNEQLLQNQHIAQALGMHVESWDLMSQLPELMKQLFLIKLIPLIPSSKHL